MSLAVGSANPVVTNIPGCHWSSVTLDFSQETCVLGGAASSHSSHVVAGSFCCAVWGLMRSEFVPECGVQGLLLRGAVGEGCSASLLPPGDFLCRLLN